MSSNSARPYFGLCALSGCVEVVGTPTFCRSLRRVVPAGQWCTCPFANMFRLTAYEPPPGVRQRRCARWRRAIGMKCTANARALSELHYASSVGPRPRFDIRRISSMLSRAASRARVALPSPCANRLFLRSMKRHRLSILPSAAHEIGERRA